MVTFDCTWCGARVERRKLFKFCSREHYRESLRNWDAVPYPRIWYQGRREYLHRVVWMKANPDQTLTQDDVVHHKDENPFNRDPSNLEKLEGRTEHLRAHNFWRGKSGRRKSESIDTEFGF